MWPEGLIASKASDVRNHPVCCFSHFGQVFRIYRIGEELSHARLTLHAASALKPPRRKGREGLKTLNHEERRDHEGWRRGSSICG